MIVQRGPPASESPGVLCKKCKLPGYASNILVVNKNLLGWVWELHFQHALQVILVYTFQQHCLKGFIEMLEGGL